jgi:hypothetical protein
LYTNARRSITQNCKKEYYIDMEGRNCTENEILGGELDKMEDRTDRGVRQERQK